MLLNHLDNETETRAALDQRAPFSELVEETKPLPSWMPVTEPDPSWPLPISGEFPTRTDPALIGYEPDRGM